MKQGDLITLKTPYTDIPTYEWTGTEFKFWETHARGAVRMWHRGAVSLFLGPTMMHATRLWGRILFEGHECWVTMEYVEALSEG